MHWLRAGDGVLDRADLDSLAADGGGPTDAHGMSSEAVSGIVRSLGGSVRRVSSLGCEPARTAGEIGLRAPVRRTTEQVVKLILDIARREPGGLCVSRDPGEDSGVDA